MIPYNISFLFAVKILRMNWTPYAQVYDPLKVGSIDGTDSDPHDKAIIRALNSEYVPDKNIKGKSDCTIFVGKLYRQTKEDTIMHVNIF
jgi:U11/U12 small nuclear ribonucleoprotein SNRNP35